jgi:hypothetical protein
MTDIRANHYPVEATFHGFAEGWKSTGLSFGDIGRMSVRERKGAPARRFVTPSWAVNDDELAELVTYFMEKRARLHGTYEGTLAERLAHAEARLLHEGRPQYVESLQNLCAEYVQLKKSGTADAGRVRSLEILIANRDTVVRMIDGGCSRLLLGVVYHYYRRGLNGLQVGEEISLKHDHVRQILYRLHFAWRELKGIEPERISHRYPEFEGDYELDDEQVFILRARGLSYRAISIRLRIPYFEVLNARARLKRRRETLEVVCGAVQQHTGEVLPVPDLPRCFESSTPTPPSENVRYKLYAQFCERLGHAPMSERVWQIQDKGNMY